MKGEFPVAALQVRSLLEGGGTPKRVRATLSGITARRLAAHRRLIAAISEGDGPILFCGPVDTSVEACWTVSMSDLVAMVGDDGDTIEDRGGNPACRRSPPLPTPTPVLLLLLPLLLLLLILLLPTASLPPGLGTLLPSGKGAEVVTTVTARGDFPLGVGGRTDTCGAGAGAGPVFPAGAWDVGRALAGKRADRVARRRLGNKVGGRTYSSMVSRRNLWSQL